MSRPGFPVDGHVHLHPCFDLGRWLAAARANLAAARAEAGLAADAPGILLLTETATEGAFTRLVAEAHSARQPEEAAIVLDDPQAPPLVVIAGRQIQTAEGLEVLAVGSASARRDGAQLAETLDGLAAEGTPAILPWGVGKWLGRRGRIVTETLAARPGLLAGDNAGRPRGWPEPRAFAGRVVLPGTDPLPHRGAEAGVGRYGFVLDGEFDLAHPVADLRARLARLDRQPRRFGGRAAPLRAALDQVRLRLPG